MSHATPAHATPAWTTHHYRCTRVHVDERGATVLVVYQTHSHPPWEWVVMRRSRWLDWRDGSIDGRVVALLPDMAEAVGSAGSWQMARRRADERAKLRATERTIWPS